MNGRIRKCNWRNYLWSLSEFNITNIKHYVLKPKIFNFLPSVLRINEMMVEWSAANHCNYLDTKNSQLYSAATQAKLNNFKDLWAKITQPLPYWVRSGESFIIYDVQAVPFLLWVKSGVYRNIGILERILRLAIRFDMGSYQVIQRP